MNLVAVKACAVGAGFVAICTPALAARQVYTYAIVHPRYGEIGTFTQAIERTGDVTRIETHLRVAVRLLGMVAYRDESDGTELVRCNRLIWLQHVANKDGRQIEIRGAAEGDHFVVSSPAGTFTAPADVAPSDPWFLKQTGTATMVSTNTGKVENVRVSGGEEVTVSLHGVSIPARHFTILGDTQREVWVDSHDVPVMFRIDENGVWIDFVAIK